MIENITNPVIKRLLQRIAAERKAKAAEAAKANNIELQETEREEKNIMGYYKDLREEAENEFVKSAVRAIQNGKSYFEFEKTSAAAGLVPDAANRYGEMLARSNNNPSWGYASEWATLQTKREQAERVAMDQAFYEQPEVSGRLKDAISEGLSFEDACFLRGIEPGLKPYWDRALMELGRTEADQKNSVASDFLAGFMGE